ncbi:MAG: hypothetical protein IPK19_39875 [Chloroflexi bacterium]|nr:hypothetical protein [Chloroflexota bacterium]
MARSLRRPDARLIEEVIGRNLDMLFPGMRTVEYAPFRVTRNADIDYEHELTTPPLAQRCLIEEGLRERRFGSIVRLAVPEDIGDETLGRLLTYLPVDRDRDVYYVNGALGGASLFELMGLDAPDLKYPAYLPRVPEGFADGEDIFAIIRAGDRLVHHPYDLVSHRRALSANRRARPSGPRHQGHPLPRRPQFPDRQCPDGSARPRQAGGRPGRAQGPFRRREQPDLGAQLEEKGVHVTFGVEELPVKTHAKVALVVRQEGDQVRRYVHLGTGNYNSSTARLYTDLGLFTCDKAIGEDATRLFNRLTGFAPATAYQRMLVAPEFLLKAILELIDGEIAAARAGSPPTSS